MQTAVIRDHQCEACMCKSFGACIDGPAMQWFMHLPPNSISSFSELHESFIQHFSRSWRAPKQADDLYSIVQKENESLQDFLKRFNSVKVTIPNCLEETAVSAFKKGLKRNSSLFWKLVKYLCSTMAEVLARAEVQIRQDVEEENFGRRNKNRSQSSHTDKKSKTRTSSQYHPYSTQTEPARQRMTVVSSAP